MKDKSVLVIEIPEEWANKRLVDVKIMDIFGGSFTLYQQKIRPFPEKKETCSVIDYVNGKAMIDEYENEFNLGFNACLDEITGE